MPDRDDDKLFRVAVGAEPADRAISPLRADLKISPQLFYGQLCFVLKDPVTLRYFRFQPVEHFLLTQLDGRRTARDLLGILQQQFPESSLNVQDVLNFVGMLHESHLLTGEGPAHAEWLARSQNQSRRRRFFDLARNFLFFKLPLFNPDRILSALDHSVSRLIFNPLTGIAAVLLVLLALLQVLANTDRLLSLPYSLLSWQNLLVLYGVFIVTKVFHEFGHGLATKHHGGEVSQMGVLIFVFTPSFYCDTSDAWMIPSRAARLWINAGGVIVELVLAALATFVWLNTPETTLLNQIALNVMISCSVATLFFNANPLLRYDGYYFLADLLEIPNLMTKGTDFLKYYAQKYLLGLKPMLPPDAKRLKTLIVFAIISGIYRWVVVFGIIALLCYFFDQYGLGPIGVVLAVAYVLLTVLWPLGKSMKFLWKQRWDLSRRLAYMVGAGAVAAALLVGVALLPWSLTIREPLVVLATRDEPIFVRTPGYVEAVEADVGAHVKKGQVIVRLSDPSLQTLFDRATTRREQALLAVTNAQVSNQPAAVAAAQTAVNAFDQQIALLRQRMEDLVLRAPIDGVIVRENSLKRIHGNYVPPGIKLCRVISAEQLEARMSLPQQQAALVQEGMNVRIRFWSEPGHVVQTRVARLSSAISDQLLHPALASTFQGDIAVTPGTTPPSGPANAGAPEHQVKSVGRRSTVIIHLPPEDLFLADGMTGRAEITVRHTTVAGRLWRMLLDSTTPDWHL